jgi:uncharacterized membrane protein
VRIGEEIAGKTVQIVEWNRVVLSTGSSLCARMLEQVEDRTMPLGNETGMTDEDRETLGRWGSALK